MRVAVIVMLGGAALAGGCSKPPPENLCHAPAMASGASPGYAADKQTLMNCVKRAAYAAALKGGPLPPIAADAAAQCANEEKAAAVSGKLEAWQKDSLHDTLLHTAQVTAAQSRALGCGRPAGAQPDTL